MRYVQSIKINIGNSEEYHCSPVCEPPVGKCPNPRDPVRGGTDLSDDGPLGAADYIGYILSFLNPSDIGRASQASQTFRQWAVQNPHYFDVNGMYCDYTFVAHNDFVESMIYRQGCLYTLGEKRCKLWNMTTGGCRHRAHACSRGEGGNADPRIKQICFCRSGECMKVMFRDQTAIIHLRLEEPRFIYSFMNNGHIRKWAIQYAVDKLEFASLYGDHCGCINDAIICPPSQGICRRHTLFNHSCFLYTCSDDRTVKVRAATALQRLTSRISPC
jgi:hypothetical protein